MERILVIGGNGCGKTTLAKKIAVKLELPLIHLDALYWRDHWQRASNEEFDGLLLEKLTMPEWIIDGNINRTIPLRLKYCDTVIFMDFPRTRCVYGAIKRVIRHYGKSRPDMGGYCPEMFDKDKIIFIKSIPSVDKGPHTSSHDMICICVVTLSRRTSSTPSTSALQIQIISMTEVAESKRDKFCVLQGT